jgi:hypothetical protein
MSTGDYNRGVKRPGREADDSISGITEVKNKGINIPTPPIRFHGVILR